MKLGLPTLLAGATILVACGRPSVASSQGETSGELGTSESESESEGETGVVECEVVEFEDPSLELYVRHALGLGDGPISGEDLDALVAVEVTPDTSDQLPDGLESLWSLKGIECAHELETLHWHGASVGDLGPLAGLGSLRVLRLPGDKTELTSLVPLAGLTELEELDLSMGWEMGQISDLTPLANLSQLRWLDLSKHSIIELSPLANLDGVEHLNLGLNPIADFSASPKATWLMLFMTQVADVTPLVEFPELIFADFAASKVSDLTPLVGATWDTPQGCADLHFQQDILDPVSLNELMPVICAANPGIALWVDEGPLCNPNSSCNCPGDWFCD